LFLILILINMQFHIRIFRLRCRRPRGLCCTNGRRSSGSRYHLPRLPAWHHPLCPFLLRLSH
jgi:hypothetical protein